MPNAIPLGGKDDHLRRGHVVFKRFDPSIAHAGVFSGSRSGSRSGTKVGSGSMGISRGTGLDIGSEIITRCGSPMLDISVLLIAIRVDHKGSDHSRDRDGQLRRHAASSVLFDL